MIPLAEINPRTIFERVSQLPRFQQQRILATVEDMLIAQSAKSGG